MAEILPRPAVIALARCHESPWLSVRQDVPAARKKLLCIRRIHMERRDEREARIVVDAAHRALERDAAVRERWIESPVNSANSVFVLVQRDRRPAGGRKRIGPRAAPR
jgi:hypothetical protein